MSLFRPNKNSKFAFYVRHLLGLMIPDAFYRARLRRRLETASRYGLEALRARVDYYNKLDSDFSPTAEAGSLASLRLNRQSAYALDLRRHLRYFDRRHRFNHAFGDIVEVPGAPCLVKSRPIDGDNRNSVLMKLNTVRHYNFVTDGTAFRDKLDRLVWRGANYQPQRSSLLERFHGHPLCDVGQTNPPAGNQPPDWPKPVMPIGEQLRFKFILSIEGNDVATNLKWIMSSNSLCFMVRPRYETWFMEGRLVPDRHYVLLQDDYSDLEEKIDYYSRHPGEAEAILEQARRWTEPFRDADREDLISLMVLEKYFRLAGQG